MNKFNYLIIGGSVAATAAAEKIREIDHQGSMAMIWEEKVSFTYPPPLITYALAGKVEWNNLIYRSKDFYKRLNTHTLPGEELIKIEVSNKKVTLKSRKEFYYEKLLLATGSKPIIPPIKGIDKKGVYTFTTLSDAYEINSRLRFVKKAAVIGGGLIGLKAAEALLNLGVNTTIVELLNRLLAPVLDNYGAEFVKKVFEEHGATVLTNTSVTEILTRGSNKSSVGGVRLSNGEKIPSDLVIVATGVAPSKELAEEAGLKTNKGILVNERMQTSEESIFAAGDVTESYDLITKTRRPILIWPNAFVQGEIACTNMAGQKAYFYGGVAIGSTTFFGNPVASAGLANPENEEEFEIIQTQTPNEKIYRRLILKEGRLIGFITTGKVCSNGLLVNLIKNRTLVKGFKRELLRLDFSLIDFPKKHRQNLLQLEEVK